MKNNQLGIFRISYEFVDEQPEFVAEVFAEMKAVVVRCELLYDCNEFEYTAISPLFKAKSKDSEPAPIYDLTIEESINNKGERFVKVQVKGREFDKAYG